MHDRLNDGKVPSARVCAALMMGLAFALLLIAAPRAGAASEHRRLGSFCEPSGIGTAPCEPSFSSERLDSAVVDQGNGDLLVIDDSEQSVSRYDESGQPADFGALGDNVIDGESGPDETPQEEILSGYGNSIERQMAIDESGAATDGNLYVTDSRNHVIDVFASSSGEYHGQLTESSEGSFGEACGVAVDADGNVYVGDYGGAVHKFAPSGSVPSNADNVANFTAPSAPCSLAAGAAPTAGSLFVAEYGGKLLKLDDTTGALEYEVASGVNTLSVDPGTGHLYTAEGSEVVEYDASGASEATVLSTIAFDDPVRGVGASESTGNLFVSVLGSANVEVYGPLETYPDVVTGAATDVEPAPGGSATLNGTVDPDGVQVQECTFEYGPSASYGQTAPCAETPAEIGSGEGPEPVHADIAGLEPGTYHFRLRASNENGATVGADQTFGVPGPPVIFAESANPADTEADLRARVNPDYAATTYHFEYGRTAAYGDVTPGASIPAGNEAVTVSAHIGGLTPGATYHFRVVTSNEAGQVEGPDRVFTAVLPAPGQSCPQSTLSSPGFRSYLPDCRAYELVSPVYTQGSPFITGQPGRFRVSRGGDRVSGYSIGKFAGQESGCVFGRNGLGTAYAAQRDAAGWAPEALSPPCSRFRFSFFEDVAADGRESLFYVGERTYPQEARSYVIRKGDGTLVPVGPESPGYASVGNGSYRGAAGDLSRIVVGLEETGAASALWPGDTTIEGRESLYEFTGTGNSEPRLVAVENAGPLASNSEAQPIAQCGAHLGSPRVLGPPFSGNGSAYNAVSPSGFAVFFTVAAGPCSNGGETGDGPSVAEVYARVQGSRTVAISEPPLSTPGRQCTGVCRESQEEVGGHARSPARYAGASSDGRRVYFTTAQPLLDADTDETADLYMATLGAGGLTGLLDVSRGQGPTPGEGALVQGVSRVSMDGSRAYFVAGGVLTGAPNANGEAAEADANNLYLYDASSGRVAFVTRLAAGDSGDWAAQDLRPVQASHPDGRFLAFESEAHPQGTGDTSTTAQLFRYDARTGKLVRVSVGKRGVYTCPRSGEPQVGYNCDGNVDDPRLAPSIQVPGYQARSEAAEPYSGVDITGDGTVFFESRAALTPQAANGYPNSDPGFNNVYEYRDGDVHLISSGQAGRDYENASGPQSYTQLLGITGDGEGVLFYSSSRLVPRDTDTQYSIYEARVDGGFPAPAVEGECGGEACRGEATEPSPGDTVGSKGFAGPGNVVALRDCAALGHRTRTLSQRARALRRRARRLHRNIGRMRPGRRRLVLRRRDHRLALAAKRRARRAHRFALRAKRCRRVNRRASR